MKVDAIISSVQFREFLNLTTQLSSIGGEYIYIEKGMIHSFCSNTYIEHKGGGTFFISKTSIDNIINILKHVTEQPLTIVLNSDSNNIELKMVV